MATGRTFSASEIRPRVEARLLARPDEQGTLLGTLVPDERTLIGIVRTSHDGRLHRIAVDLDEIYEQAGSRTAEQAYWDCVYAFSNVPTMAYRSTDEHGVREYGFGG